MKSSSHRGVNNLENDHDLEIDTFSCGTVTKGPESGMLVFSVSEFIFGKRFLMDDLRRD